MPARTAGRVADPGGPGGIERERLLHLDVLAGSQRRDRERLVGRAYVNDVDPRARQHRRRVGRPSAARGRLRRHPRPILVAPDEDRHVAQAAASDRVDMMGTDEALPMTAAASLRRSPRPSSLMVHPFRDAARGYPQRTRGLRRGSEHP